MSSGKSILADASTTFIKALWDTKTTRNGKVETALRRKAFLAMFYSDVDAETLDKLTATLEQAGLLIITMVGNEITYALSNKGIEIFMKGAK